MAKEPQDKRLQRASAVQKIIRTNGYKILLKEWKSIKEQAFADLINQDYDKDTILLRQKIYIMIKKWIDIPKAIIAGGETAITDSKEPEPQGNFIKRAVKFIGRRDNIDGNNRETAKT